MKRDVQKAYFFCKQKTKREAKNFYYAFLLLPRFKREAIYVAYAFARECDDIVDEPSPNKPEQLQQLRQFLSEAYQQKIINGPPLFLALQKMIYQFSIPQHYFEELIEGMEMDLTKKRYQTFDELYQYCYKVASVVGLICIYIFRFKSVSCLPFAVDLGIAMQLTNILRDIAEDARIDRIYLPLEELAQYHISEEAILRGNPDREAFSTLMQFQIKRAEQYFSNAQALLPFLEKDARICPKILQNLYQEILRKIETNPYNVFEQKIRLTFGKKLFLMLTAGFEDSSFLPTPPKKF